MEDIIVARIINHKAMKAIYEQIKDIIDNDNNNNNNDNGNGIYKNISLNL